MCREHGITIPIIPGVKVLRSVSQMRSLPKTFHIDLPDPLVDEVTENPKHVDEIGMRWAIQQCQELLEANVPSLHLYVLNDAPSIANLVKKLQK